MWVFTRYGFFSAVKDKKDKATMVVRARRMEHLNAIVSRFSSLKNLKVSESHDTDYAFRIRVPHKTWNKVIAELSAEIDYSNFKGEVKRFQGTTAYEVALHEVWHVMAETQITPPYSNKPR